MHQLGLALHVLDVDGTDVEVYVEVLGAHTLGHDLVHDRVEERLREVAAVDRHAQQHCRLLLLVGLVLHEELPLQVFRNPLGSRGDFLGTLADRQGRDRHSSWEERLVRTRLERVARLRQNAQAFIRGVRPWRGNGVVTLVVDRDPVRVHRVPFRPRRPVRLEVLQA